jgi:two-component system LytT family response regulator
MTPSRCIVVDDEPHARHRLEALLGSEHGFEVVDSLGDPSSALQRIVDEPPDVVFLDVGMPGMDGLRLLAEVRSRIQADRMPYVVLVTAFDRYALEAFDYEAIDYLAKPFPDVQFHASLGRARERLSKPRPAALERQGGVDPVPIGDEPRTLHIAPDAITWVESSGHYLLVHQSTCSRLVRESLTAAARLLEPHGFVRVHRGALINPTHVVRTERSNGDRMLCLSDGSRVAVSRRRWPEIRELL